MTLTIPIISTFGQHVFEFNDSAENQVSHITIEVKVGDAVQSFEFDTVGQAAPILRNEVLAFALLMERKLRMNEHKGTWKNDSAHSLWYRIGDEAKELYDAFDVPTEPYIVGMEAADVANFAMMVADVSGGLG